MRQAASIIHHSINSLENTSKTLQKSVQQSKSTKGPIQGPIQGPNQGPTLTLLSRNLNTINGKNTQQKAYNKSIKTGPNQKLSSANSILDASERSRTFASVAARDPHSEVGWTKTVNLRDKKTVKPQAKAGGDGKKDSFMSKR